HVRPELFAALVERGMSWTSSLTGWVCTEVTRTCIHPAAARAGMGADGPPTRQTRAGDITTRAEVDGTYEQRDRAVPLAAAAGLPRAACEGRADLSDVR